MSFLSKLLKVLAGLFKDEDGIKTSSPTPVTSKPAPVDLPLDEVPRVVELSVVSVRSYGELVTREVMAKGGVLPAKAKVRVDCGLFFEGGRVPVPDKDKTPAEDILYRLYYGDSPNPDLEVRGDVYRNWDGKDLCGKHWVVSHQGIAEDGGIGSLANTKGFGLIAKLAEGVEGTSEWRITCEHDGVVSNPVGGRAD